MSLIMLKNAISDLSLCQSQPHYVHRISTVVLINIQFAYINVHMPKDMQKHIKHYHNKKQKQLSDIIKL